MTIDRLDDCDRRLDDVAAQPLEAQADTLELVHRSLVAELDELLDTDRRSAERA